ncbi:MAG: transcription antitermination factor NusB [Clostridia bacterium]|nr:transcription antitermination factor NusB [Clostridia bacterium]
MRRDSREAVYKILFAELFSGETDVEFDKLIFAEQKLTADDCTFANQLLTTIREHKQEINDLISTFSKGYKFERIYSTDKCALIIAVCELKYFDDIPSIVSIDEALSLVRKYSTEESLNFVNGVLASLKKSLEV